ncbi:DUF3558 domain-containing protein [Streptomyces sp. NPDC007264]|uniref:DUF3558 domain-containing protein n=1 Tax=Streptomyces sp. NPDC007264 TaxID=3364777 RepID=UPI0036D97F57
MQRKAYVPGAVMLLAALLAACSSGSGGGGTAGDSKASGTATDTTAAQPGKYRTLSDACGAVRQDTLESLLPGLRQVTEQEQRDRAYAGEAALTYSNDRRSGCRWKAEAPGATDHLFVDFERVVSYDNAVSDDSRAQQVFAAKEKAAGLPAPDSRSASPDGGSASTSAPPSPTTSASGSPAASGSPSATGTPVDLRPRTLDDLGDEAFLNDQQGNAQQRTVTVVFRTSNVVVTIEYEEQSTTVGQAPSSEDMQDKARKLAGQLDGSLG